MGKAVIGYKVVRRSNHSNVTARLSAAVHSTDWAVVYTPGYPSYGRQSTPLFAFDSLPHAQHFAQGRPNTDCMEVWKAGLTGSKPRRRLCSWVHNYLQFWSDRRGSTFQAPEGTLACGAITLLEQV